MPRPALPADLGRAFRVRDALGAGVAVGRLRGRDLQSPFHGVRTRAAEIERDLLPWEREAADLERRIASYLPLLPRGAFFVGPTAAFLHGMPLPRGIHEDLHVAVTFPRTAPLRAGVRGVQVLPRLVTLTSISDVPVTDGPTTWAMLGRTLGRNDLVAVADHLLRIPRHPGGFRPPERGAFADRSQLVETLHRGRRLGIAKLREALPLARTGSSSRAETWMRLVVHDGGLPEPELDYDVYDDHGRFLGCSELAYPLHRLAIEYESDGHLTRAQLERDIDKYTAYAAAGWSTIRLTSRHVYAHPSEAVGRVRAALHRLSP